MNPISTKPIFSKRVDFSGCKCYNSLIPRKEYAMKKSKTLYVSDLDETLLRSDERLSAFTVNTVNALVERGMTFTL